MSRDRDLSQPDYYESPINDITTSLAVADQPPCPTPEDTHEGTHFDFGETVYLTVYYHDALDTQQSQGLERLPSDASCQTQLTGDCP